MKLKECIENQKEEIKNANFEKIRIFSIYEDLTGERIKKKVGSWLTQQILNSLVQLHIFC